jgi:hypothetical protein
VKGKQMPWGVVRTFKEDYANGLAAEDRITPRLEKHWGMKFNKLPRNHKMDRFCEEFFYEHKDRNKTKDQYDTTIIPYGKILWTKENNATAIFGFTFTDYPDSLFYIKYDPERFKDYEVNYFVRAPRPDHKDVLQLYCYIPISDLTEITFTN